MSLGGEKGIRTPETLLMFTRFPGGPVQPLLHLSENAPKSTQYFPILQMTAVFSPFGIRVSALFRSGGVLPSAPFCGPFAVPGRNRISADSGETKTGRPADLPFSRRREAASLNWLTPVSTDYVLCAVPVGAYRRTDTARASGIILFLEANLFRAGLPVAGDSVPLSSLVLFTCRKEE